MHKGVSTIAIPGTPRFPSFSSSSNSRIPKCYLSSRRRPLPLGLHRTLSSGAFLIRLAAGPGLCLLLGRKPLSRRGEAGKTGWRTRTSLWHASEKLESGWGRDGETLRCCRRGSDGCVSKKVVPGPAGLGVGVSDSVVSDWSWPASTSSHCSSVLAVDSVKLSRAADWDKSEAGVSASHGCDMSSSWGWRCSGSDSEKDMDRAGVRLSKMYEW